MGKSSDNSTSVAGERGPSAYRRVVVKLGSNLLAGPDRGLDLGCMASLVRQIAEIRRDGMEVVLVSSGAMASGREILGRVPEHRGVPLKQVLASVGQGRLMQAYDRLFGEHGITVAQALVSRGDLSDRLGYLNVRNTLNTLLELGVQPIVNENDVVAVEEIKGARFGDNDNLSAMVANLVDADLLMILSDVAGLYTADPMLDPRAKLIPTVESIDDSITALAEGTKSNKAVGGMVTKLQAAGLATASGVDVVIAKGRLENVIARLAGGEGLGTFFPSHTTKMESRKRWMLSGLNSRGSVRVDGGAASAVVGGGKSLLPAGVVEVSGSFERGDVLVIEDGVGNRIACGLSNYDAEDARAIAGERSGRIFEILGYEYGAELVHRDNLVLL